VPQLARVLGNNRGLPYRFLEDTGTDLDVFGIREEALLAGTVRKLDHEETIDLMPSIALQGSTDFEVVSESAPRGFKQEGDFPAISRVLLVIDNQQTNNHFEKHRRPFLAIQHRVNLWNAIRVRSECNAPGALPLPRVRAAVDVEHLSRDEGSSHQEQSSIDNLLHRGKPRYRMQALQRLMVFGLVHGRVHDTGRNCVYPDALRCILNRKPSGN
jgi:hypothetical protein